VRNKLNCWEFKNCGREKGGLMADILGECPVSKAFRYDGLNGGVAGGRACWMTCSAGCPCTPSPGRPTQCHECEFYRRVVFEEENQASFMFSARTA